MPLTNHFMPAIRRVDGLCYNLKDSRKDLSETPLTWQVRSADDHHHLPVHTDVHERRQLSGPGLLMKLQRYGMELESER